MEKLIKCPICGEEIKETYYSSESGLDEEYINCDNCGYFYDMCFGLGNEGVHNLKNYNPAQLSILKENMNNLRKVGFELVINSKGRWVVVPCDILPSMSSTTVRKDSSKDKYLYGLRNMKTGKLECIKCKGGKFYEKLSFAKKRRIELYKRYHEEYEIVKYKLVEVDSDEEI